MTTTTTTRTYLQHAASRANLRSQRYPALTAEQRAKAAALKANAPRLPVVDYAASKSDMLGN